MEYREDWHLYTDGLEIIPSVTQILADPNAHHYTPGSAERGTEAHEACAAFARNPEGIPENSYAYAFAMWCWKRSPKWLEIEEILEGAMDGKRFAGRLDGLADIDGKVTLIDWKTGVKTVTHYAQVAAYMSVKKPARGLVLYLHKDGTYTEDWLTSTVLLNGMREFLYALRNYNGKNQNNQA